MPCLIAEHADIQATLFGMATRMELLRALNIAVANHADLSQFAPNADDRAHAAALNGWLLPIVKTLGGEIAFNNASDAIQVLGGAGYTREWPVEQALRDARVLTIFEGTTGMQAQDLLFGVSLGEGKVLRLFCWRPRKKLPTALSLRTLFPALNLRLHASGRLIFRDAITKRPPRHFCVWQW